MGEGRRVARRSWKRVGFLRDLVEEDVDGLIRLRPMAGRGRRVSGALDGDLRLSISASISRSTGCIGLPIDDGDYEVDLIDTWEMTVTPAKRIASPILPRLRQRGGAMSEAKAVSAFAVEMPGKPFQAIRVRRARRSPDRSEGRNPWLPFGSSTSRNPSPAFR